MIPKALKMSNSEEWATPQTLFDKLNEEFHFTLDPCCTHKNAKCDVHYTKKDNGLKQPWHNMKVFMNPPYGRKINKWMEKAYEEAQKGATVVCLVPSRTDVKWWHDYVMKAKEIRFIKGRIKFGGARWNAPFPNTIVIFQRKRPYKGKSGEIEEIRVRGL